MYWDTLYVMTDIVLGHPVCNDTECDECHSCHQGELGAELGEATIGILHNFRNSRNSTAFKNILQTIKYTAAQVQLS